MKSARWPRLVGAMGAFSIVALCAAGARAQSTTDGAVGGLVTDQSGASVPGATVTARNVGTNATAEAVSDGTGRFLVIRLQPGVYSVETTLSGFTPVKRDNVIVEVGRVTNLDVQLGVAAQTELIQVTAQAPIINTEQSDFSTNIDQTQIANLPTNTRRWSTFALMTPGAAPDGNFGLVSFRGISGLLNSNTVDGGDNTQAFFAEERGRTRLAYSVSADAVREFQVSTSNYSAEYGRAAGGVVNAVTKSGTNDFHGSGFYFIRDNKWGSTNPFQTQTVLQNGVNTTVQLKPDDRRQQFGGTIGGPLQKDRAFFFFSYDQQKRNFPGVAAPTNPSSFFAPFSAAELATFASRGITTAQAADGLNFLQGLTGVVPRTGDQTLFLPKVDLKINNNNTLAVTYNRLRWESPAGVQTAAVVNRGVESWGNDGVQGDWVTSRINSVIGSRMTNELKFQWGRDFEFQASQAPLAGEPVSSAGTTPAVDISGAGGISFGKPNFLERRAYPDERRIDVGDTFTWSTGSHLIKFGGDVSRVFDKLDSLFQEGGVYAYSNRVDFITDYETRASATGPRSYTSFSQGLGPTAFEFTTFDYDVFVQDTWHANPQTTVNLGLRYEYEKLPAPQIANPLLPATSVFPSDKNNFGPRIGVAYDLSGRGNTVVRGGYGIFYGRIINSTISNAITNVGSSAGQFNFSLLPGAAGAPRFPNIVSTGSTTIPPSPVVFKDDTQNPLIHQYDAIIEQRIAANTMVSVAYVGSAGRYLPLFIDTNLPNPSGSLTYRATGGPLDGQNVTVPVFTGARPNANFAKITTISNVVESKYNAVILQINRRLSGGLQLQASYTEARATDNGQSSTTFTSGNNVLNPFDLGLEEGTSNFEIRHRFVANAIWSPTVGAPGTLTHTLLTGFTVSPTFNATSGVPYTAVLTGNAPVTPAVSSGGGVLGAGGSNRLPSIARNAFNLPNTANFDLRVSRAFTLGGGHKIEGILDIFNVTDRMNYTQITNLMYTVGGTAAAPTLTYNSTFGTPNNGNNNYFVFTPRQVQIAVRYNF